MSSKTILLVEDNQSDIDLTIRAFEKAHILNELVVAEDGQQALDLLLGDSHCKESWELPALILLDINLPKVDGIEVLRAICQNEITHNQLVVILTSSTEERDMKEAYDLGVNSYIRKPVDFRQFSTVIESLGNYWLTINETPPV
ncbi:response regulator [bacterium]|nr:response regulator [bacterium]